MLRQELPILPPFHRLFLVGQHRMLAQRQPDKTSDLMSRVHPMKGLPQARAWSANLHTRDYGPSSKEGEVEARSLKSRVLAEAATYYVRCEGLYLDGDKVHMHADAQG